MKYKFCSRQHLCYIFYSIILFLFPVFNDFFILVLCKDAFKRGHINNSNLQVGLFSLYDTLVIFKIFHSQFPIIQKFIQRQLYETLLINKTILIVDRFFILFVIQVLYIRYSYIKLRNYNFLLVFSNPSFVQLVHNFN